MIDQKQVSVFKAALNYIDQVEIGGKYSIVRFSDTLPMPKADFDLFIKDYDSVESLISEIIESDKELASHIYISDSSIPTLLKSVGYLLSPEDNMDTYFCGREVELQKMSIVFRKRIKNNILLIGEPGVGKTSIVKEYSKRNELKNVFVVECAKLIGNSEYRGSFEQRVIDMIEYGKRYNLILFFDEIHALMNLGRSIGGMSITDILKPYLLDYKMIFIGATTKKESKVFTEDEAFKRRFSIIRIEESTREQLRVIKRRFEDAISSQVILDSRDEDYVYDRLEKELPNAFFPDKLIDFLDYLYAFQMVVGNNKKLNVILDDYIRDQEEL